MTSKIQSVLIPKTKSKLHAVNFPKNGFTLKQSHNWLLKHNYKIPKKVDETEKFYRYRQLLPNKNYNYTTEILPNGVELVLMWRKPLEGGAKRQPNEPDPEIKLSPQEYKTREAQINTLYKTYQLKDLLRQYIEETKKNISYKTATKKRLIELIIKFGINPSKYILPIKNPIARVPANVLKKYGLKKYDEEEQKKWILESKHYFSQNSPVFSVQFHKPSRMIVCGFGNG